MRVVSQKRGVRIRCEGGGTGVVGVRIHKLVHKNHLRRVGPRLRHPSSGRVGSCGKGLDVRLLGRGRGVKGSVNYLGDKTVQVLVDEKLTRED